jgi:hypothetical protein
MKLVIATPFYSMSGFSPYITSLISSTKALSMLGVEWDFWELSGDSYVDRARNTICARFSKSDYTHMLFIDSDMAWDVEGFLRLLKSPHELTGGLYPVKNNWENYCERLKFDENNNPVQDEVTGHIECEYVPSGFMLIKKSCIEKMIEAYKNDWYYAHSSHDDDPNEKVVNLFECSRNEETHTRRGEDVTFCHKWTAIGGKCFLEPRISFGHCGMKAWYGNFEKYWRSLQKKEQHQ